VRLSALLAGHPHRYLLLDSTPLAVCDNHRIHQHQVFAGLAQRGKTSIGWCFGFKLHLVFNDRGELLTIALTPGNVDDRKPVLQMVKWLFGKVFADKGYLSQPLFQQLLDTFGIQLITKLKSNMKNRLMPLADKLLLRKRATAMLKTIWRPMFGCARRAPLNSILANNA